MHKSQNRRPDPHFFLLLLFTLSGVFIPSCSIGFQQTRQTRDQQTQFAEEAVEKDKILQELDGLCKEVPVFEDYSLIGKDAGRNRRFISYFYSSPSKTKVDYASLRNFYLNYFQQNGWLLTEDRDFASSYVTAEKDKNEIEIYYVTDWGRSWGETYSISCAKSK